MAKKHNTLEIQKTIEELANKESPKFIDLLFKAFHEDDRYAFLDLKNYFADNMRNIQATVSVRCRYALHAILYIFRNENPLSIIKRLSKSDVDALNKLIAGVKKHPIPEYEGSLGLVAELPEDNPFSNVATPEEEMRRKIAIIHVNVWCYWDTIVAELQKWSDKVAEFQQAKAKQNGPAKSNKADIKKEEVGKTELWSYQELANHLGLTKTQLNRRKHYLLKTHPEYRDTVNGYFINGRFKPEYFNDFQALLNLIKHYNRKSAQKTEILPEAMIEEVPVEDVAEEKTSDKPSPKRKGHAKGKKRAQKSTKKQPASIGGMAGVKALEKRLAKWVEMLQDASERYGHIQQEYAEAQTASDAVKDDPVKRAPFLDTMLEANKKLVKVAEERENLTKKIDDAQKALSQFQEADKMLKQAEAQKRQASDVISKLLADAKEASK
jgi:hypothetical protein